MKSTKKQRITLLHQTQLCDISIVDNPKVFVMILLYIFPTKDSLFLFLSRLNKRIGICFLKQHFATLNQLLPNDENFKFKQVQDINQHESGINQIVKISNSKMLTISDDCSMKIWKAISETDGTPENNLKMDNQVSIETTSCIALTGSNNEYIVTGCHSGNIHISKIKYLNDCKTI